MTQEKNNPSQIYNFRLSKEKISYDENQHHLLKILDNYFINLKNNKKNSQHIFKNFFERNKSPECQGLYIYGPVGTGKSMIMDIFYESIKFLPKSRIHFHEFMRDIHKSIDFFRKKNENNPIKKTAESMGKKIKFLCLDEFQINDITDAMIVGRLFKYFFEMKIFVFITSNIEPKKLYKNGINRETFVPFIDLILKKLEIRNLNSNIDYRKKTLKGNKVYFSQLDQNEEKNFFSLWKKISESKGQTLIISSYSRNIRINNFVNGVAKFKFEEICGVPLSSADYILLVKYVKLFFIEYIPQFSESNSDKARRFINFIDTLYDNKCTLVCLALKKPEELYLKGPLDFEFERTVSRLIEMQSKKWLFGINL